MPVRRTVGLVRHHGPGDHPNRARSLLPRRGPRMITLENVTKRYGQFTAVNDVSFTAQQGKVTGFLGPNGAGKSTSMRIMVGLDAAGRWARPDRRAPLLPDPEPGPPRGRAAGRVGAARRPHRPRGAAAERRDDGGRQRAGRRDARPGGALRRRGEAAGAQLLARHAPAARHRQRADGRALGADPRRAGQRARPRRHPLDAQACCATSPRRVARCCCPRTCSTRSR